MKYRNSSFIFVDQDGTQYGVHFEYTRKKYGGRGEQVVTYTRNGKLLGNSTEVRGNHNKSNALYFLKLFLATLQVY